MKLSRTAWNNVIIIVVMSMILLINVMNSRLFPDDGIVRTNDKGEQLVLPKHAVIVTLSVPNTFLIERSGQTWQLQKTGGTEAVEVTGATIEHHALEQMMKAWKHSAGLLQADTIEIAGVAGIDVIINLADEVSPTLLTLYPLSDQLLINDTTQNKWIALSPQLFRQLLPPSVYPEKN